ncbi:dehydrogenase with different specificities-chain alcohol dehydrogenases [Candidatus Scalindua japonica]|uniref:Dehydrogenase with different specificities-chain alcohol dehydrogenases n=1 Tax=Candidatus Scalindua japonica TaxID=1284222 RepID=A0A286TWC8_9BACT|nr:dehydrogenase with different specificities-chain alcohol dehydrogenases [Candidatus Scalindua japonica]
MAQNHVNVIVHYCFSSDDDVEEALTDIKVPGVEIWKFKSDFSNIDNVDIFFEEIRNMIGTVDILINNASIFSSSKLSTLSIKELSNTLTVNSIAPFRLSQHMAKQKHDGCIINILDSRVKRYDLGHAAYQISKNMLYHMTEMMAVEFAPQLRVNGIAPGIILPPDGKDESYIRKLSHRNLFNRSGKQSEITDAVLFLLTNTFVTGEVLFIDGGQNLKGELYE